jgi:hypothetical protein
MTTSSKVVYTRRAYDARSTRGEQIHDAWISILRSSTAPGEQCVPLMLMRSSKACVNDARTGRGTGSFNLGFGSRIYSVQRTAHTRKEHIFTTQTIRLRCAVHGARSMRHSMEMVMTCDLRSNDWKGAKGAEDTGMHMYMDRQGKAHGISLWR